MSKRTSDSSQSQQPDRYLLITEERSAGWDVGKHYYHQYARVVTQRYEGREHVPYGPDDTYGDGLLYSGLRASCQGDERSQIREVEPVYGIDVAYHECSNVDLRKAKRMIKTLEKIDRGLEKIAGNRGYVRTWGDYAGRIAEVLGCKGIVIEQSAKRREMTDCRYQWMNIGEGVNEANRRIYLWQREALDKSVESEQAAS